MKRTIVALTAFIALLATLLPGPISPANANSLATDANIASLSFGSPNYVEYYGRRDTAELYPNFNPDSHTYNLVTVADILDVNVGLSDPLATIKITFDGVEGIAQSDQNYRIDLLPKVSVLHIDVTAQNRVNTKRYTIDISNQILISPEIVSLSSNTSTWSGGKPMSVRVKKVLLSTGTVYCYPEIRFTGIDPVSGQKIYTSASLANYQFGIQKPDADGITTIGFTMPSGPKSGFVGETKVSILNSCYGLMREGRNWLNLSSESTTTETMTFLPLEITDVVHPSTVTGGSIIEVKSPSLYSSSQLEMRIKDLTTDSSVYIERLASQIVPKNNIPGSWQGRVDPGNRNKEFSTAGKKKLEISYWNYNSILGTYDQTVLYSKEINWKPTVPTSVTVSPAKSDIAGGKRVRVEGFNLCDTSNWPQRASLYIDGKPLTNIEMQYGNEYCGDTTDNYGKPKKQWFTGLIPVGTSTGIKNVTVDNGNGPVRVSATFTYGATPEITSVSQASVASTGGSKIRLTGRNYGFSGTPTVIIGGKKSPKVILVSDELIEAIVPTDIPEGTQGITVISSSAGGANLVPASINVVAPTLTPTLSSISTNQGLASGGDTVTLSVGNLGSLSTVAVMFGINQAEVIRVSETQVEVKVPSGAAGITSVTLSTALGQTVVPNFYTYNAVAVVRSVTPTTVSSTADAAGRTVTIVGVGFGASGTIKIGTNAAQQYVSSDSGTTISGIVVPNLVPGSLAVLISPQGSPVPLATSVTVTRPSITYAGPEQEDDIYNSTCRENDQACQYGYGIGGTARPSFSSAGGGILKIKGTGFGVSGSVRVGNQNLVPVLYSDTAILLEVPALAVGAYDLTVVPNSGLQSDIWTSALFSVLPQAAPLVLIDGVMPVVANTRGDAIYSFDQSRDTNAVFEVSGDGFLGSDNGGSTKVFQIYSYSEAVTDNSEKFRVNVLSITDNKLTFSALRTLNPNVWTGVVIETTEGRAVTRNAIRYVGDRPPTASISNYYGLCTKDPIKTHNPAVVTVSGAGMFGESGTVTLSGQTFDPAAVTWSNDSVSIDFSKLPTNFAERWGQQTLEFVPSGDSLISKSFSWFCGVLAEVQTKVNGSTETQTISAGDNFTVTATIPAEKRLDEVVPSVEWPTTGFQYMSAADYVRDGAWNNNVKSGLPTFAGDWYVRANPGTTTELVDRGLYAAVSTSDVRVVIEGTAIAFTPKLTNSTDTSILYRGQLGDGTNESNNDIEYTIDVAAEIPAITNVVWEHRNFSCAEVNSQQSWNEGLPGNVAIIPNNCGGDDSTASSWDIRIRSFEMMLNGKDMAMFYLPTFNTFNLTIEKRALTIDKVTATKPYNGNADIYLGALTVSGAIEGETPSLQGNDGRRGYFANAEVGENKPVYVSGTDGQTDFIQRIRLDGSFAYNYYLTNGDLIVLGSITKANARLSMSASNQSLVLSVVEQSTISTSVIDIATGSAPLENSGVADVIVTVSTPTICSISAELVVTALATGECIVQASQAASANYNAAVALSDSESNIESLTINVYAQPKKLSVIAQDLTIGQGETPYPSYEVLGLADGDALNSVVFDYYDGATKLDGAPSEPGRYTVVGSSVEIATSDLAAYDANIEFVAGVLLVTSPPPTITGMSPENGPQAGGDQIVITGTNLGAVTAIRFGSVLISSNGFQASGDGTELRLLAPAGSGNVSVILVAGDSELSLGYSYDPSVASITDVAPTVGSEAGGNIVVVSGTNLDLVSEVRFGDLVIESANLTRNVAGTSISFRSPAGTGKVNLVFQASSGTSSFEYTYTSQPQLVASVTTLLPSSGFEMGGNAVMVSGSNLQLVTAIRWGTTVIAEENLTRSEDGTTITLAAPAGTGEVTVSVETSEETFLFVYTYKVPATPSMSFQLMNPEFGIKFAGQMIKMTAGGLMPGSTYTLNMYSKEVTMATGTVSLDGKIKSSMRIPTKACVKPGLHTLILESENELGEKVRSTFYVVLGKNCMLSALVEKVTDGSWSVRGLRFDYQKWSLTAESKATIKALKPFLNSSTRVKVSGFTETDGKGTAVLVANKALAKKRVAATISELKANGLKVAFVSDPVGSKIPVSKVQSKNRRVEMNVRF